MTQDCLDSLSTADGRKSLPNGIHIIGAETESAPKVEGISWTEASSPASFLSSSSDKSWSYLHLQHMSVIPFLRWLDVYNSKVDTPRRQPYFVHRSYRYRYRDPETQRGIRKTLERTISGFVFLQGKVKDIQTFLKQTFPQYHLVNNCSTGRPAVIPDAVMQPFMRVSATHPEQVTFLREPFEKFARDHVKLRVLTGPFRGYEGYVVRIDRDRQLVFDFGGIAVAIRGVHNEDFLQIPD